MKHQQIIDKLAARFLVQALDENFSEIRIYIFKVATFYKVLILLKKCIIRQLLLLNISVKP